VVVMALIFWVAAVVVVVFWVFSYSNTAVTRNLKYKGYLVRTGLLTLIFSKDKKQTPQIDPDVIKDSPRNDHKRVIFIRHGESQWNEVFNKGLKGLFVNLGVAILAEIKLLITRDSVFF